jgi:hypothetical protein
MGQKIVGKPEHELEDAIADVIVKRLGLESLPLARKSKPEDNANFDIEAAYASVAE